MGARRGELQQQLRAAEERRLVLADQAARTSGEARGRIVQRLEALDQRITQIESQLAPLDEAIAIANGTPFGLAAYFYTESLRRAWRVGEALEFGMVGLNTGAISTGCA